MKRCAWCGAVGGLILSWAWQTSAQEPRRALEADLHLGWTRQIAPSVDHTYETWSRNGGIALHAGILLRSPYFLSPFLDVGYVQLYSSDEEKDLGAPLGTVKSQNSLSAWSLVGGPAVDIGRVRVRAGIGMYRLQVRSTILGTTITPAELDLGYLVTLGVMLWRSDRWKVGLESRALLIAEAETAAVSLGFCGAWDTVKW